MIYLKAKNDLLGIKQACEIWKQVKNFLIKNVKVGMSTKQVDILANQYIKELNAAPTFYHLYGFPGYMCISINEQLIHGIGNDYILKPNDLITCDLGITYKGYICDSAFSWILPPNDDLDKKKILTATYECLMKSIKQVRSNNYVGDISNTIENIAQTNGYKVIKDYGGHGCGFKPHEDPIILCYGKAHSGVKLVKGMVLCIEPMLLTKSDKYVVDQNNNWTVSSKNKLLTCHMEHMVYVTESGYEILTYDDDYLRPYLLKEIE